MGPARHLVSDHAGPLPQRQPRERPPAAAPWTSDWFAASPWEGRHGREFYESAYRRNYGGDLDGLEQQLPYLRDLGVNAPLSDAGFQGGGVPQIQPDQLHPR